MSSHKPPEIKQGDTRFGYVAVLGRPNVGKSTLVNRLVGTKVSIVSRRPQTTRHRVLGVATHGPYQAAYVDTPGVHKDGTRVLNRTMVQNALAALEGADVGLFLVEGTGLSEQDRAVLERVMRRPRSKALPWICGLTKSDLVRPRDRLLERISELSGLSDWTAIIPLCARRGQGIAELQGVVEEHLPKGPHMFPSDQVSDRSLRFMASELIREQLMRQLGDEIPHRTAVSIDQLDEEQSRVRINASILVERDGQKAIVIGAKGQRLKSLGSKARVGLEALFERKVILHLWVRVRSNWSNSEKAVRSLGIHEG